MMNHQRNPDRIPGVFIMTARRDGTCQDCGEPYRAGDRFKWWQKEHKGYHISCSIVKPIERQDIANVPVKKVDVPSYLIGDITTLFDGRFTIPFDLGDGKQRHITLWISTRKKGSWKGQRRIRVFHKRDNQLGDSYMDAAYIKNGTLRYIESFFTSPLISWQKLQVARQAIDMLVKSEQQEAVKYGMQYALLSRRCWRCHRILTNPKTLKLESGCGPICDKFYAQHGIDPSQIQPPTVHTFKLDMKV